MRMRKIAVLTATLVLAGLLAACGGNESKSGAGKTASGTASSGSGQVNSENTIDIKATNFEFDKEEYRVKTGEVTINFYSVEGVHGIEILKTKIDLRDGQSTTVTFDEPGEYEIICNIPCGIGHAKMFAKLIVEA